MKRMRDGLKIGELADRCGVSRDTIRFYEREKLLPRPRRSASSYRVYADEDASRVLFIRQAQAIGLTLDDIRELVRLETLRTPDECERVAGVLRERIAAIDRKVSDLRAFRKRLARSLGRCESAHGEGCPVVVDLMPATPRTGTESSG
jgi:DNA-binding transcriptional MerR regulator